MIPYRNRAHFLANDVRLAEALDDIAQAAENIARQANALPSGAVGAPPGISALNVTAAGGVFDIALTDNAPVYRGINYFVEYSSTAAFVRPTVIDLGASRNWRGFLGNQTFYFRAYSSYPTSPASAPVYFGGQQNPAPVVGGGAISGPAPLPSTGSGTASSSGQQGNSGFGSDPFRSSDGRPPSLDVL